MRSTSRTMTRKLHLRASHREQLKELLNQQAPEVEVWAYGSRVTGESHEGSDLDLVLRAPNLKEVPKPCMSGLRKALHESTIPFLVDIHDWTTLPTSFQEEIMRNYVVLIGQS